MLQLKNISKSFAAVQVLHDVNFTLLPGEVHALLGMNGAGKSTLMKIMCGAYLPSAGTIHVNEQLLRLRSPKDAQAAGIGYVAQEVDAALFHDLTIAENVSTTPTTWLNEQQEYKEAEQALALVGLNRRPTDYVRELTIHEKQLVLLAKILHSQAKFIILDEPTASLSKTETEQLFTVIRNLQVEGISFIYISHKLDEVLAITDRVTVMRNGRIVAQSKTNETTMNAMIEAMVGERTSLHREPPASATNDVALQYGRFIAHRGEIIGIAGLVGAGKTELAEQLFGANTPTTITINGQQTIVRSVRDSLTAGIALVPEERRKQALFLEETLDYNIAAASLAQWSHFGVLLKQKIHRATNDLLTQLKVKPNRLDALAEQLSGGNQQKVVIAKALLTNATILLFDEPTKGVDIHAQQDIFAEMKRLAEEGKTIIYLTSEFHELVGLAHRVYVMRDGTIAHELHHPYTEQDLLLHATGGDLSYGEIHL